MSNNRNGMPAYQKIQRAIQRRIESGRLKPGEAVDSERELARAHGVSLMTARHALSVLEREGVVHRRRGAGTFVAPPKIHFNKLMSFTEQMSGRNLAARSKVVHFEPTEAEPEVEAEPEAVAETATEEESTVEEDADASPSENQEEE